MAPKERITARVRVAVTAMVEEGLSRPEAAAKAGLADHSLYQALQRPLVASLRNQLMEVKRTSAASRTIARAESLADTAASEHVRLQANEWLGGIAGIVPVQKHESAHNVSLQAGLTIEVIDRRSTPELIDLVRRYVRDNPNAEIEGAATLIGEQVMGNGQPFPEPVPHPALVHRVSERDE